MTEMILLEYLNKDVVGIISDYMKMICDDCDKELNSVYECNTCDYICCEKCSIGNFNKNQNRCFSCLEFERYERYSDKELERCERYDENKYQRMLERYDKWI